MEQHIFLTQQIKAKLLRGERLTVWSVFWDLKTFELRHYVSIINKDTPVKSEWKTNPQNNKRYKEYYLDRAA